MENRVVKNSEDIKMIFTALRQLLNPPQQPRKKMGYKVGKEDCQNPSQFF